jgi:hypothetical protein
MSVVPVQHVKQFLPAFPTNPIVTFNARWSQKQDVLKCTVPINLARVPVNEFFLVLRFKLFLLSSLVSYQSSYGM